MIFVEQNQNCAIVYCLLERYHSLAAWVNFVSFFIDAYHLNSGLPAADTDV